VILTDNCTVRRPLDHIAVCALYMLEYLTMCVYLLLFSEAAKKKTQ